MAQRILGMGDVLIADREGRAAVRRGRGRGARAQAAPRRVHARRLPRAAQADPQDGPAARSLLGMIPGFARRSSCKDLKVDERELDRIEAIILSMTAEERRRPELIKGSRRLRIAKGSGTNVQAVNQLVKQFGQMRKMMKQIGERQDARHRRAHEAALSGRARRRSTVSVGRQLRSLREDTRGSTTQAHPCGRQQEPDLARRRRRPALPARRPRDRDDRAATTPRPSRRRS